jgi:hypothetical protein
LPRGSPDPYRLREVATASYQSQLESVQAAIAAIEGGAQSYSIAGRSLTRGDLSTLYEREQWLRGQVTREEANGGRAGIRVRGMTPVG